MKSQQYIVAISNYNLYIVFTTFAEWLIWVPFDTACGIKNGYGANMDAKSGAKTAAKMLENIFEEK